MTTKTKVTTKSPKSATKVTAKPAMKPNEVKTMKLDGYRGMHKTGSRKGTLHELFDTQGREVALTRGKKMGLADNTLRAWINAWRDKSAPKAKVTAKPKSKVKTKANGAAEVATSA
jgi:hypothetical protein